MIKEKERKLQDDLMKVINHNNAQMNTNIPTPGQVFDSRLLESDTNWHNKSRTSNMKHSYNKVKQHVSNLKKKEPSSKIISGVTLNKNADREISGFYVNYHNSLEGSEKYETKSISYHEIEKRLNQMGEDKHLSNSKRVPKNMEGPETADQEMFTLGRKKSESKISRFKDSEKKRTSTIKKSSSKIHSKRSLKNIETRRSRAHSRFSKKSKSARSISRVDSTSAERRKSKKNLKPRHKQSMMRRKRFSSSENEDSSSEEKRSNTFDSFSSDSNEGIV